MKLDERLLELLKKDILTDEEYEEKLDNKEELYLGEPKEDKGLDLKPLKL